eukprot:m.55270 g.55270  ORF g.55270 m.55270 type:complete len:731 (+) comp7746_c0_seq2:246-2438(+)
MQKVSSDKDAGRFSSLLKPIRDLAHNWDIDVARELEEYITEIDALEYQFQGSSGALNFAEAALLIQGSACVYSRKVEYLYKLVYDTLDMLAAKRQRMASSIADNGEDADAVDLLAVGEMKAEEEFLSLDDIPVCEDDGKLMLRDSHARASANILNMKVIPPELLPAHTAVPIAKGDGINVSVSHHHIKLFTNKGEMIGRRGDFRMNTSIVHESGALLSTLNQSTYITGSNIGRKLAVGGDEHPLSSTLTSNGHGVLDFTTASHAHNPGIETGAQEEEGDDDFSFGGGFDNDFDDDFGDDVVHDNTSEHVAVGHEQQEAKLATRTTKKTIFDDPWAPLDPHESTSFTTAHQQEQPVSHLSKFLRTSLLRTKHHKKTMKGKGSGEDSDVNDDFEEMVEVDMLEERVKIEKEKISGSDKEVDALTLKKFFDTLSSSRKRRTAFDSTYIVLSKMRPKRSTNKNTLASLVVETVKRNEANFAATSHAMQTLSSLKLNQDGDHAEFYNDENVQMNAANDMAEEDDDMYDFGDGGFDGDEWDGGDAVHEVESHFAQNFGASNVFGGDSTPYEELVRQHVAQFVSASHKLMHESDLTKRVRQWEEKIGPVLNEEARHRPFDIHQYGEEIVTTMTTTHNNKSGNEEGKEPMQFSSVARAVDVYEVARKFLATLSLANLGNVEIVNDDDDKEEKRRGNFSDITLYLLSQDQHHKNLSDILSSEDNDPNATSDMNNEAISA